MGVGSGHCKILGAVGRRASLGFVALNLLAVLPLLWIAGSYVPDRLDLHVRGVRGDERVMVFRAGVSGDGADRASRVTSFSFASNDVQRLKFYFNSGCPTERLEFGFENGSASVSIDTITVMHRCVLMQTLKAADVASCYEVVGDARLKENGRGGLDVELLGGKVLFRPKRSAAGAWKSSLGTDRRLVPVVVLAELVLLFFSIVAAVVRNGGGDSRAAVAAKSASVSLAAVLLFVVALPIQSYLANRSGFPFTIDAVAAEIFCRAAVCGVALSVALFTLHPFFSYVPHAAVLGVVVSEYLDFSK